MFVPVGKLNHEFQVRVDRFGGTDEKILRDVVHFLQTKFRPRFIAFCGEIGRKLRRYEEKVIENDFVEVMRGELHDVLNELAVLRVGVAIRLDDRRAARFEGHTTSDLHAFADKKCFHFFDQLSVGSHAAAGGFNIDFVNFCLL